MILTEPKYVDFTATSGFSVRIGYQESYDTTALKSDITIVAMYVSSPWSYLTYYLAGNVKVEGVDIITLDSGQPTHSVAITEPNEWAMVDGDLGSALEVVYNADGSKSVTISINISGFNGMDGYGNGWNVSGSETVELTRIERGTVYIDADMYQCFIDNGSGWDMCIPHVDNGTSWDMCS